MLPYKLNVFLDLSLLSYIVSSVSILGVWLSDYNGTNEKRIFAYFTAILFWLGMICGTILFYKENKCRKMMMRRSKYKDIKLPRNIKIGAVSFFNNKEAAIVDVLLFVVTLMVLILSIFKVKIEGLIIVSVMLWFLFFILHCFFNGKNHKYIKLYKKCFMNKERTRNE